MNSIQNEVLFGSLLGDASIYKYKKDKNPNGKIEHCSKQLKYLQFKKELLKDLSGDIKNVKRIDKRFNKERESCHFLIKANSNLFKLYNDFYESGKKKIPDDLSLLTPLAIAIWFMDDGYKEGKSIGIATQSFTKEDVLRLINYLLVNYDIEFLRRVEGRIYLRKNSFEKFKKIVLEHMCESMKYKLHVA